MKKIKILLLFSSLFFVALIRAQVTIGSQEAPEPAALLQVKEYNSQVSGGNTATKGGILLPRVKLKSLSDITVIAATADSTKKLALTGLLVYNVDTLDVDEGLYEWDGKEWCRLKILSDIEGSYTKRSLVKGTLSDTNLPIVNMGIFAFRLSPDKKPQCKLNMAPSGNITFWYHIGRFWDYNGPGIVNEAPPQVGYSYDAKQIEFTSSNYSQWQDLHSIAMNQDVRYEVWIADTINSMAYNIQFLSYTTRTAYTYIVLVTGY